MKIILKFQIRECGYVWEKITTPTMPILKTVPINHVLSFNFDKNDLNFEDKLKTAKKNYTFFIF